MNAPVKKYRVDEMAKAAGHEVVRLPPYHCTFNPIELVWADEKAGFYSKIANGCVRL